MPITVYAFSGFQCEIKTLSFSLKTNLLQATLNEFHARRSPKNKYAEHQFEHANNKHWLHLLSLNDSQDYDSSKRNDNMKKRQKLEVESCRLMLCRKLDEWLFWKKSENEYPKNRVNRFFETLLFYIVFDIRIVKRFTCI